VLLALMGIYSVIAFSAAMRTQEMAIRLALGAPARRILRLVLVSGAKLGCRLRIGAVAAVFATRLLRSLLFEVDPLDPMVIGLAAISISCSLLWRLQFPHDARHPLNPCRRYARNRNGIGKPEGLEDAGNHSGHSLRAAAVAQVAGVHADRDRHAGAGHWRQHGDLHAESRASCCVHFR